MRPSFLRVVVIVASGLAVFGLIAATTAPSPTSTSFGVTFSTLYAEELGLDWRETYLALVDDLGVRKIRLPLYWNRIEPVQGEFDWSESDWLVDEAAKRGVELTLVVGRKTPRWPECHEPEWVRSLDKKNQQQMTLNLIREEMSRYRSSPAVVRWQVENEPLFPFGHCPPPDRAFLKREVEAARSLDGRPIMLTDSGELSTWARTAVLADTLGVSLYRMVWHSTLGFLYWPVSPRFYSDRFAFVTATTPVEEVIVSELQMEPWFHKPIDDMPFEEQFASMDLRRFRSNVDFVRRTGASEAYLWGAEWWYWLKTRGHGEFWEAARGLFR